MKELTPEEEILIQNKIDELLSANEKKAFDKLLKNSEAARMYYEEMIHLQNDLEKDSLEIERIDIVEDVMSSVKKISGQSTQLKERKFYISKSQVQRWIAYAAILFVGLFIGGVSVFYTTQSIESPDSAAISGTIRGEQLSLQKVNAGGVEVGYRNIQSGDFKSLLVVITTSKKYDLELIDGTRAVKAESLKIEYAENECVMDNQAEGKLILHCSGNLVFQLENAAAGSGLELNVFADENRVSIIK